MSQDPDSSERKRCVSCGKWMLVRAGNPCCPDCTKSLGIKPRPEAPEKSDPHDESQCSYCGAIIYFDSPRCPKCGEYTDGLGPRNRPESPARGEQRLPRIFVIAGWILLAVLVIPILILAGRAVWILLDTLIRSA